MTGTKQDTKQVVYCQFALVGLDLDYECELSNRSVDDVVDEIVTGAFSGGHNLSSFALEVAKVVKVYRYAQG